MEELILKFTSKELEKIKILAQEKYPSRNLSTENFCELILTEEIHRFFKQREKEKGNQEKVTQRGRKRRGRRRKEISPLAGLSPIIEE